jgi:hypothetical protein
VKIFEDSQPRNPTTKLRKITIHRWCSAARSRDWLGLDAMKAAPPDNETERLNTLRRYQILDTWLVAYEHGKDEDFHRQSAKKPLCRIMKLRFTPGTLPRGKS